jgi:hypothetical protein
VAAIRQVRLHLEQRSGLLRKAAKLIFGGDGSLYLMPYARRGQFFYGSRMFSAGQESDTFNFREQVSAASQPKLSIHATGAVHIYANGQPKAGPLQIPRLDTLRGEHVASVRFDAIEYVPEFRGKPRAHGQEIDMAFGVPPDITAGALHLYVNGAERSFNVEKAQVAFQVERANDLPIFVGLAGVDAERLGDDESGGVTVLAGFNPRARPGDEAEYLYLRGM